MKFLFTYVLNCCIIISSMFGIRVFGSCCITFFFLFFFLFCKTNMLFIQLVSLQLFSKKTKRTTKLQRTYFDENRRLEKFFDIYREKILRLLYSTNNRSSRWNDFAILSTSFLISIVNRINNKNKPRTSRGLSILLRKSQ